MAVYSHKHVKRVFPANENSTAINVPIIMVARWCTAPLITSLNHVAKYCRHIGANEAQKSKEKKTKINKNKFVYGLYFSELHNPINPNY